LEGEKLRVTVKPGEYVYLDLSKRYFPLPGEVSSAGLGEPILTPEKVHLPVHCGDVDQGGKPGVAWDFNLLSLDGYSPETGWIRIDTSKLASIHIASFEKRRSVQRKASKSKKARRVLAKYSKRERNRAGKHQLEIARVVQSVCGSVGLEELEKQAMYTRSRIWNRRISRGDWRSITRILVGRLGEARVVELDPYGSSSYCSRCGWFNRDLNGADIFVCGWWVRSQNRQAAKRSNKPLHENEVRIHCKVGGWKEEYSTEDGGRFPEGLVGHGCAPEPCGWVRPDTRGWS